MWYVASACRVCTVVMYDEPTLQAVCAINCLHLREARIYLFPKLRWRPCSTSYAISSKLGSGSPPTQCQRIGCSCGMVPGGSHLLPSFRTLLVSVRRASLSVLFMRITMRKSIFTGARSWLGT